MLIKDFLQKKKKNKGFTILEMIIVIGIFGIITAVVIFNYNDFNSNIIMTNLTYEVALELRQAQVYSLGVRAASVGSDRDVFETQYGVYFNKNAGGGSSKMIFYADTDSNGVCDDGAGGDCGFVACSGAPDDECREILGLTRNIEFSDLCASTGNPIDLASGTCGFGANKDEMTIRFSRPNPDALIETDGISGKANAAIVLSAPNGARRAVVVRETGQISVEFIQN